MFKVNNNDIYGGRIPKIWKILKFVVSAFFSTLNNFNSTFFHMLFSKIFWSELVLHKRLGNGILGL